MYWKEQSTYDDLLENEMGVNTRTAISPARSGAWSIAPARDTRASRVPSAAGWNSIAVGAHLTEAVDEVRQDSRENGRRRQDEEIVESQQRAVDCLAHTLGGVHGDIGYRVLNYQQCVRTELQMCRRTGVELSNLESDQTPQVGRYLG